MPVFQRAYNGMDSQEKARQILAELVDKFTAQSEQYNSADFNEIEARSQLINPFFEALGWDIHNKQGLSLSLRPVVLENPVEIEGNTRHADYAFRFGNKILFFVEAKKPSVHIKDNQEAAYQTRCYGWNKGVKVCILTNFKEFTVYDCTKKPNRTDKASVCRLTYLTERDYSGGNFTLGDIRDGFDFLWNTFAYENVIRGSLDRYAENTIVRNGIVTVDEDFLRTMEDWREILAKNICRNNKDITEEELNFAVQETLNRIVFLRMAESRGIEPQGNLLKAVNVKKDGECYKQLYTLFQRADEKYNSGIFNFDKDNTSEKIAVDNKVLQNIIKGLYYPSPYNFEYIPVEFLGSIYEQFLGKIIRLTAGHQAKVEEKIEIRKSGGVYYTPQYIVNYIIENTIRRLTEGKTPKEVAKIKVVDPACGSGSFLLGAYRFLLDWHQSYYEKEYREKKVTPKGLKSDTLMPDWSLTTTEKKKILTNNIFGVDIDVLAVETAKLSLLMKCMEGETTASIENAQRLFHENVLPNIDSNIQDGNSLVDTDFYELDFDAEDENKIKPFHWQKAFPQVFKQGGFDAVIGNPPYVRPHRIDPRIKPYFWKFYETFIAKSDLYSCFMEKGIRICRKDGLFSFIVPNTWTSLESFEGIRKYILKYTCIKCLTQLPKKVFKASTVATCIFLFQKNTDEIERNGNNIEVVSLNANTEVLPVRTFPQTAIYSSHLHNFQLYGKSENQSLLDKLSQLETLDHFIDFKYGFKTGSDAEFLSAKKATAEYKPFIRSGAVKRYYNEEPTEFVLYHPVKMRTITRSTRPGEAKRFENEKIIAAAIGKEIVATYDKGGLYVKDAMLLTKKTDLSLLYILGLLNSKLIAFYYKNYFATISILKNALLSIPIKNIDGKNKQEVNQYNEVIKLVTELLRLYDEKKKIQFTQRIKRLNEKITYCEDKINEIVYHLYGLTEEEIKIIEESKQNGNKKSSR